MEGIGDESGGGLMTRMKTWIALVVALAVASVAVIVVFSIKSSNVEDSAGVRNRAIIDQAETAAVLKQTKDAMISLWSYDYRSLDKSRTAAEQVGTPAFMKDYADVFKNIDKLAPQTKAIVTATVPHLAVRELRDDKADVIVFLEQQATKQKTGQKSAAGARLRVEMQRVDGLWKVASAEPF